MTHRVEAATLAPPPDPPSDTSAPLPISIPSPITADIRACFRLLKPICVQLMEQQTQRRLAASAAQQRSGGKGDDQEDDLKASPVPPFPSSSASSAASLLSTLEALHAALQSVPWLPVLYSLNYVLFPLTSFLCQPLSAEKGAEAAFLSALSSLTFLLRATCEDDDCTAAASAVIGDGKGFAGLWTLLVSTVRDAGSSSDEVRAAAIDAATALLEAARAQLAIAPQSPLAPYLLSSGFHVGLGYLVSLLLPCLASTSRLLQRRALQCGSAACALLRPAAAGVAMLTSYMPGLLSALHRLLVKDDRAGTQVKVEAVRLMTDLLTAVMTGDDVERFAAAAVERRTRPTVTEEDGAAELHNARGTTLETNATLDHLRALLTSVSPQTRSTGTLSDSGAQTASAVEATGPSAELLVRRDSAWFAEARQRVLLILRLTFAQSPTYPRSAALEREYVRSARALLERCGRVLRKCVVLLVDYVLAMTQHVHHDVRSEASAAISAFVDALSTAADHSASEALIASLSSRLLHHLRALPRVLQSSTQPTQLRILHTASGYMQLLGSVTAPADPLHSPLFALLSSPSTFPPPLHPTPPRAARAPC